MMYKQYTDTTDLYILHRFSVGGSQGDGSFLEEVITTGNDKPALEAIGEQRFPKENRSGWRWDEWMIVVNTATVEGSRLWGEQKILYKQQWKDIEEHPDRYEGAMIIGNRDDEDSVPIAVWMQPNPVIDSPSELPVVSSYQFIVFDVSDVEIN